MIYVMKVSHTWEICKGGENCKSAKKGLKCAAYEWDVKKVKFNNGENKRKWKSHERFGKNENLGVKIVDEEGNLSKKCEELGGGLINIQQYKGV